MSSEELELTQLLCESLLVSDGEINPGGEEAALSACSRLRHTVDTLLELLNQANTQVKEVEMLFIPHRVFFLFFFFPVLQPCKVSDHFMLVISPAGADSQCSSFSGGKVFSRQRRLCTTP